LTQNFHFDSAIFGLEISFGPILAESITYGRHPIAEWLENPAKSPKPKIAAQ
jgi:hypothetical protein